MTISDCVLSSAAVGLLVFVELPQGRHTIGAPKPLHANVTTVPGPGTDRVLVFPITNSDLLQPHRSIYTRHQAS